MDATQDRSAREEAFRRVVGDRLRWGLSAAGALEPAAFYFFQRHGVEGLRLITAEGTLEAAPTIGYADVIADLVSTGTTLRDNRLRVIEDGLILYSQACLIASRSSLKSRPRALAAGLSAECHWQAFGWTGERSAGLVTNRLATLPEVDADYVIVSMGVNDVTGLSTRSNFAQNMRRTLRGLRLRYPRARIAVAGLPPLATSSHL